ncbi:MAG: putative metal-binding motif-containing protein, partial [Nitrospirota bacterium]
MFKRHRFFILLFSLFVLISSAHLTHVSAQTCLDNDGDGYGKPGNASCPKGNKTDCDDSDPKVYPGAPEICDGKDSNCDGWKPSTDRDSDGDGVPMCKNDCNDNDPTVYPGAAEICDGKDNNCDYRIPTNEKDGDGDGYLACGTPADCNDNDPYINPGMQEWCSDGKDNNCNSQVDEPPCICPDADNDGFTASYCGGTDCVDTDNTVYPGAPELCTDGKDNDCNGLQDCSDPNAVNCPPITDADGDGYDIAGICGTPDCDDSDPNVYPGAP